MRLILKSYFSLSLISLVFSSLLLGQNIDIKQNISANIPKADSLFKDENYSQAIIEYQKLLDLYPQEPQYHYKIGVSYLNSSREILKAIEHLKFASTREVPNLVYYHLGVAHQLYYLFDDAISYFRRFTINGGDPSISNETIERLVSQCENGIFMLRYVFEPKVIDSKRVPFQQFHPFVITKSDRGSFIPMPNDLKTPTDIKQGNSNVIFYPSNPQPGDKIIYSSYGSTTSFGKDLYIIEMLSDGFWTKPKDLGNEINTNLDEDFAYLAPDGVTLYFASNGHYSMGGYDIYKSVYNPISKKWSSPENLGFPFSSPYDDFLFVPNENNDMAIVVTNRNTASDSVDVVLVSIDPNPIRRAVESKETIRIISSLMPNFQLNTQTSQTLSANQAELSKQSKPKTASFTAVENDPEYARALAQGFAEQMKADSLRIRLESLRARFDFISTAQDRIALEKQVVSVEDALLQAQRNADIQFARASQIEQEFLTGKRKPENKQTTSFASDKPKYLYQAQFAPTVFQADELNRLSQLENATPQIEKLRAEVLSIREKVLQFEKQNADSSLNQSEYNLHYVNYINRLKSFNSQISTQVVGKKKLYNDCISVALMKSGSNNNLDIRGEIDRANSHFRSATAIRNNISDETRIESEFEALLLEELGVQRLEIAFAKLWGMRLFEQQLLSNLYRLEQIIFGKSLPDIAAKQVESETKPNQTSQPTISITMVDTIAVSADTFVFQPEKEPSFQVLDKSPYDQSSPIPPHEPLPPGVLYKIQLAAFSNPVKFDLFKGMVPISAEPVSGGKVTKYYAGNFSNLDEAEKALPIVRSKGFKDAFIVAWHNGRSVPPVRAKSLESGVEVSKSQETVKIDIVPNDKLYVIQLGNFTGRIPEDVTQTIRALAPGKDIVRKPDGKSGFIYSVGSFTDINEANRVKDNLVASGIKNAFVVALDVDN